MGARSGRRADSAWAAELAAVEAAIPTLPADVTSLIAHARARATRPWVAAPVAAFAGAAAATLARADALPPSTAARLTDAAAGGGAGADAILVLHHGEVAERGTHAELLERGGLYAALWRLQAGDDEPMLQRAG